MVDGRPERRERAARTLSLLFALHAAALITAVTSTLIWPDQVLSLLTSTGIHEATTSIIGDAGGQSAHVLAALGFESYARGFLALHTIGSILVCAMVLTLIGYFVRWDRDALSLNVRRVPLLGMILVFSFAAVITWWSVFNGDFYSANDGDFSGAMRPWFGSLAFGIMIWIAPYLLVLPIVVLLDRIFVRDSKEHTHG